MMKLESITPIILAALGSLLIFAGLDDPLSMGLAYFLGIGGILIAIDNAVVRFAESVTRTVIREQIKEEMHGAASGQEGHAGG